jgi:mono/diheme cytochrome c family protein
LRCGLCLYGKHGSFSAIVVNSQASNHMDISRFSRAALAGAALLVAAVPASAETGRLLASQCAQCHGTNGAGPGFEQIAGKDLFNDLIDMKYRPIEGIMDRQARGYTDAQLRLIADYLSTLPGNGDN